MFDTDGERSCGLKDKQKKGRRHWVISCNCPELNLPPFFHFSKSPTFNLVSPVSLFTDRSKSTSLSLLFVLVIQFLCYSSPVRK